jgi:hypothetical protein
MHDLAPKIVDRLYIMGDSHGNLAGDIVFCNPETGEPQLISQQFFVPIRADLMLIDDELHSLIATALQCAKLLLPGKDGRFYVPHWGKTQPLLIVVGSIDLRDILKTIPLDAELQLPFDADLSALRPNERLRIVNGAEFEKYLIDCFRPFMRCVVTLQKLGLERVMVAAQPPPTTDDDAFLEVMGFESRALVRYQLTLFVNHVLRTFCRQASVPFIDVWDDVTANNVVRDGWLPDHVHLKLDGVIAMLNRFIEANRSFEAT